MQSIKAGFSLVELSVVLIIIGLLIGGVVSGRKLIEQSQGRKAILDIQEVDKSIQEFRLLYNCLPGDCDEANALGFGTDGDGDNIVEYTGGQSSESLTYMWNHMDAAGIYKKKSTGGGFFAGSDNSGNLFFWKFDALNVAGGTHSTTIGMSKDSQMQVADFHNTYLTNTGSTLDFYGLSARLSYYIDKKMDDGTVNTGDIISMVDVGGIVINEGDCGSTTVYDIVSNKSCILLYDFPSLRN